jgi:hypothetical protein
MFVRLVVDGWCWFILRERYCWLVGDGWFILRENYCWLVADKPNEQGARMSTNGFIFFHQELNLDDFDFIVLPVTIVK